MKLHAFKQTSVAVQLSSQKANEQKNREMLCIVLNSLKYLGLAIRGHDDESGNLRQLLSAEDYFRQQYFEAFDLLLNEILNQLF